VAPDDDAEVADYNDAEVVPVLVGAAYTDTVVQPSIQSRSGKQNIKSVPKSFS
jgi:hypothetical protein